MFPDMAQVDFELRGHEKPEEENERKEEKREWAVTDLPVPEKYWPLGGKKFFLSQLEEVLCSPTDLVTTHTDVYI